MHLKIEVVLIGTGEYQRGSGGIPSCGCPRQLAVLPCQLPQPTGQSVSLLHGCLRRHPHQRYSSSKLVPIFCGVQLIHDRIFEAVSLSLAARTACCSRGGKESEKGGSGLRNLCLMWWQVQGRVCAVFGGDAEQILNASCYVPKLYC